jgi:hypothetical protein
MSIDSLEEIIAAGAIILAALLIIAAMIRWFFNRGGKLAIKGATAQLAGAEDILAKLNEMEAARQSATALASKREQLNQSQWRRNFGILGGIVTALHDAHIGNGNLAEAQRMLAECEDARDEALVDQIGSA